MRIAIVLLGLTVVMSVVFVTFAVRTARSVRRRVERARREVRRTLNDAALLARAAQPGVLGEVARVRRELRASVDGTRTTLLAGAEHDGALREALALLDQLAGHAGRLDGELALLMAGEPDRARIAARLPALRERADRIRASSDSLRAAAQERAHHDDEAGLDALHQQIAIEANALRHWSPVWRRSRDRKAVEDAD